MQVLILEIFKQELNMAMNEYNDVELKYKKVEAENNYVIEKFKRQYPRESEKGEFFKTVKNNLTSFQEFDMLSSELSRLRSKISNIKEKMVQKKELIDYFKSKKYYFKDMPIGKEIIKTNSDGKFSINIRRNERVAIYAATNRQTLKDKEFYTWIIWASLDGKPSKNIILSNHNKWDSDSPDAILNIY